MVLTHIDLKYASLIYRKIRQKVPNGKGLKKLTQQMGSCISGGGGGAMSYTTFGTWGRGGGDKKYIYFFYFWLIYAQY